MGLNFTSCIWDSKKLYLFIILGRKNGMKNNRCTLSKILILCCGFLILGVNVNRYLKVNARKFAKTDGVVAYIEPTKYIPVIIFDSKQDYAEPTMSGTIIGEYRTPDFTVAIYKPKLPEHLESILDYHGYSYILIEQQGGLIETGSYQVLVVFSVNLLVDIGMNGTDHPCGMRRANFGWYLKGDGELDYFYIQNGLEENTTTNIGYMPDDNITIIANMK